MLKTSLLKYYSKSKALMNRQWSEVFTTTKRVKQFMRSIIPWLISLKIEGLITKIDDLNIMIGNQFVNLDSFGNDLRVKFNLKNTNLL